MSKWGLFCLQKRWLGRATGIIFQHIKSQWQEGGKLLSMSTADRRKNNELKLQQEKVRKDIRKNFLGKKKKKGSFAQSPLLQAIKYSSDKPISGMTKV